MLIEAASAHVPLEAVANGMVPQLVTSASIASIDFRINDSFMAIVLMRVCALQPREESRIDSNSKPIMRGLLRFRYTTTAHTQTPLRMRHFPHGKPAGGNHGQVKELARCSRSAGTGSG